MAGNIHSILFLFIYFCRFVECGPSLPNYYDCKTISVAGAKVQTKINGFYQKMSECNAYPVYKQQDSTNVLYFKVLQSSWVIGKLVQAEQCENMVETELARGLENKLFPHIVEKTWNERTSAGFRTNEDLKVECNDVYWTMGCIYHEFPIMESRCYNATNAIEVLAVQVISLPKGKEKLCGTLEQTCLVTGKCDLEELQCRKNVSVDDYDFQMAKLNCDGRHLKCHSFMVQPRYHSNCDIPTEIPCMVQLPMRTGIVVQYRCRRSTAYVGPQEPVTSDQPSLPQQNTLCPTTSTVRPTTLLDKKQEDQAVLINYVAPPAGVLFSIIIIAVIVITIGRKRKRTRPTVANSNHLYDNRTYANIPGRRFEKPRPDIKQPKKATHGSTMDPAIAQAVAKLVLDADPALKAGQTGDPNDVLAVVIMDKKEVPKAHRDNAVPSLYSSERSTGSRVSVHKRSHHQVELQPPNRSSRMAAPRSDYSSGYNSSSSTRGMAQSRQGNRPNLNRQLPAVSTIFRNNAGYGTRSDR